MDGLALHQLLTIYLWFPLAVLLGILLMIARFYQNISGERTRYSLFAVPIVLFALAIGRYASVNQTFDDIPGDFLLCVAGLSTLVLVTRLYRQMTAGR